MRPAAALGSGVQSTPDCLTRKFEPFVSKQHRSGLPRRLALTLTSATSSDEGKKVVIVGGGFAGFGAAKHLAEQGYKVTLIDGSDNPGGLSRGWRTPKGRAVEAGTKGFWYQYHNIFKLVREMEIEWPFTDWTTSGFWSPSGLTTEAPIFSSKPRLPALVGQFVHTAPLFWYSFGILTCFAKQYYLNIGQKPAKRKLPLSDRATMLPWLWAVLDVNSSPEVYARYDKMTAKELFQRFRVSQRMYDEFLRPTLLVGLFAEPEDLSAAAVLNTLYFYALAHQADFDVCWCKGSVSEKIFLPLVERIKGEGAEVVGSTFVTGIEADPSTGRVVAVKARKKSGQEQRLEADAVVFAIGVTGMQKIVEASDLLSRRKEFQAVRNLKSIDVISTRLWFDRKVNFSYPANVLAGFEDHAGATFFDLNTLQDEYRNEHGSVVGSDFYGATEMLGLSDDAIVARVVDHITCCEPALAGTKVVDSAVLKFAKAVTHFSPGSHQYMPEQQTSFDNVFIAGDWVKNIDHGANGLSQERAYVTGLRAANMVVRQLGFGQEAEILQVEPDEAHIAVGKRVNRLFRSALEAIGLEKQLLP